AHGDREFGYILTRLGVPRVTVVGHVDHAKVTGRIGVWARAAAGWNEAQHMRMDRFGDNMRNVAVTEGDKTEAEIRFGVSVNTWGVNELAAAIDAVPDSEVDALVKEYGELYDIADELRPGADRHESLRYAARQEAAIRGFLEAHNATAFTDTFEDLGALKQLPGLAVPRLMDGGASLREDYRYHRDQGAETILGAHMLGVGPSLTAGRRRLEIHPLGIGDREDPVRLVFDADPGDAVVLALSDIRDRFRLTANV